MRRNSPEHRSRNREAQSQLGTLASGEAVYDRSRSHIHDAPGLRENIGEALTRINPNNQDFLVTTVEFDKTVGENICVETTDDDDIVYARRPGRAGLTRFVRNRNPEPSSAITVVLKKVEKKGYLLITAFIGPEAGPEPWDANATAASKAFWKNHALTWGSTEIVPGTETTVSPDTF